jgi:hypothetical protein
MNSIAWRLHTGKESGDAPKIFTVNGFEDFMFSRVKFSLVNF